MLIKFLNIITVWSSYCITIWGWRKTLLAIGLGGVSTLALPPLNLFFVLFFTMPSLLWLIDGAIETTVAQQSNADAGKFKRLLIKIYANRSAFNVGFFFGFGYFFFGLFWIGEAFLVEASEHIYLLPFAILLLPIILSIFWGLAVFLARVFWSSGFKNVMVLTFSLTFFEVLRGHLFTGFPWNLLGFAFDFSLEILQTAAVWGIYGLTFWAILLTLLPSLLVNNALKARYVCLPIALLIGAMWVGGAYRLSQNPTQFHDNILLRLVQANIAQTDKWQPEMRSIIANRFLELSSKPVTDNMAEKNSKLNKFTHLIWPESALPFILKPNGNFMREATRTLPSNGILLTGGVRKQNNGPNVDFYNSIMAFDSDANRVGVYDKHHLVPFGEYLPYSALLKKLGFKKIVAMKENFSTGDGPQNIYLKNTPALAANICFEVIFSGQVVDRVNRPEWILNVTNDAWFGETIGPYQHLAQAKLRAIEEGLPLVRNANTGFTVIFDALGRTVATLPKGKAAVLDSALPIKVETTPYVFFTSFF